MTVARIRVELPFHLQTLARTSAEVTLEVPAPVTASSVLDALERSYPMLRGTVRDHVTKQRRPFLRYFGCQAGFVSRTRRCAASSGDLRGP